ncbi:MAG: hypothetical protein DGJ47_000782 [Rickettsiaceae bacterium]
MRRIVQKSWHISQKYSIKQVLSASHSILNKGKPYNKIDLAKDYSFLNFAEYRMTNKDGDFIYMRLSEKPAQQSCKETYSEYGIFIQSNLPAKPFCKLFEQNDIILQKTHLPKNYSPLHNFNQEEPDYTLMSGCKSFEGNDDCVES